MKLTNILLAFCMVGILLTAQSISAGLIVYCPTSVTCDNKGTCATKDDNGFSIGTVSAFTNEAGTYAFIGAQTHEIWNQHTGAQPTCWYTNVNGDNSEALITTRNTYYAIGNNWLDHPEWGTWQTCPPTQYMKIVPPQTCPFSTTKPSK